MDYKIKEEEMERFQKAYAGVVETTGMTYNLQEYLNMEGYFAVKVTPLRDNLFLLEKCNEGELKALVEEVRDWIMQWFIEIRPWCPEDVYNERLTRLRCYVIPCHPCSPNVFKFMSKPVGTYVYSDDDTT